MVFIILLTLINLRGVRESLAANLVASVIEVTGLVIVIVLAAMVLGSGNGEPARLLEFAPDVPPLQGAFAASVIAFFSFLGFEAAANMAEEVRNPAKAYPRALFGAISTAALVYLLIALGAVIVLPPSELATSTGPLLDVVNASGAGVPPWLFSLIALVAIASGALLFMVMAGRVAYGLAEAELLPRAFGRVLPKRRTPWVSIVVVAGLTIVLTIFGDLATLAATTVLLLLLVFLSANVSVLVLKKDKVEHKHFSVPRIVRCWRSSPASHCWPSRPASSGSADSPMRRSGPCCSVRPCPSQARGTGLRMEQDEAGTHCPCALVDVRPLPYAHMLDFAALLLARSRLLHAIIRHVIINSLASAAAVPSSDAMSGADLRCLRMHA